MARVVLECGNALVQMDRVEVLEGVGHTVSRCSGPGRDRRSCPVMRGERCPLLERADVVIDACGEGALDMAAATSIVHPGLPLVVVVPTETARRVPRLMRGVEVVDAHAPDIALLRAAERALANRDRVTA